MRWSVRFNGGWRPAPGVEGRRWWWLRAVRLRFESRGDYVWTFEIFPRVLLAQLAALAVIGYFAAATALYFWLGRTPNNQVSWHDLAWPWRWSQFHVHRGDTDILDARDDLYKRNYTAAYLKLSVGVARSPANANGRILLAQLLAGGEPARALRLMEEGLRYSADNVEFVRRLLGLYEQHQSRGRALATLENLIARQPALPGAVIEFAQNYRLGLLLAMGRHADCLKALAGLAPASSPTEIRRRLALEGQALVAGGQLPAARLVVARLLEQAGLTPEDWRGIAEICVGLDDADGVRRALLHLKADLPGKPWPYVFAFQCWHRLKRPSLRDAAENEFHDYFANSYEATQFFSANLVVFDLEEALDRVRRRAVAAGLNDHSFKVHQAELLLRRGDFNRAIRHVRSWEGEIARLPPARRFYSEFVRQLAQAAFKLGGEEQTALFDLLESNRWQARPELYQFAADTLARSSQRLAGEKLVQTGLELFPHCDSLLSARVKFAEKPVAVDGLAAPNPQPPGAEGKSELPATGPAALAALDALLAQDSLAEARELLARIRQAPPRWLPTFEAPVMLRELELSILAQDAVVSRGLARAYLGRFRQDDAVMPVVGLMRRLAARQRLEDARLLADEIKSVRGSSPAIAAALGQVDLPDDLKPLVENRESALAALDRWLAAGEWRSAERLIERLRARKPPWGADALVDFRLREIRLRLALNQRPQALQLLREMVLRAGAARAAVFQLAREYLAQNEQAHALTLARELARLLPDNAAALKLLDETQSRRLNAPATTSEPAGLPATSRSL